MSPFFSTTEKKGDIDGFAIFFQKICLKLYQEKIKI
jgi:hypothetical protein